MYDVYSEHQYLSQEPEHGWFRQKYNNATTFLSKHITYPVVRQISRLYEPINYTVDYLGNKIDSAVDVIIDYNHLLNPFLLNPLLTYNDLLKLQAEQKSSEVDIINLEKEYDSYNQDVNLDYNQDINLDYDHDFNNDYDYNHDFDFDNDFNYSQDIVTNNTDLDVDKQTEIDNDKHQKFLDSVHKVEGALNGINIMVSLFNIIKNFDNMKPEEVLTQIEALGVSCLTSDPVVNGFFKFFADIAHDGEITKASLAQLGVAFASKYFDMPLQPAYNLVHGFINHDSAEMKQAFIGIAKEVACMIIPGVRCLFIALDIIKGIESLFSHVKIHTVAGIDAVYTDNLKIGFFKIRHKVSLDNDFFDIHVTATTRHASDAKRIIEAEFKRQLNYKVYQVIGIPVEFINDTFKKPGDDALRFEKYGAMYYLRNLENNWIKMNSHILTEDEIESVKKYYFETKEEKEHRYELLKKGLKESWFDEHKRENVVVFFKSLYNVLKKIFKKDVHLDKFTFSSKGFVNLYHELVEFFKDCYNEFFNHRKVTAIADPEKYENEIVMKIFEKARDYRKNEDALIRMFGKNKFGLIYNIIISKIMKHFNYKSVDEIPDISTNEELTNFLNSEREDYKNHRGDYSRENITKLVISELYQTQQTLLYSLESAYSNLIGFIGSNLAYADREISIIKKKHVVYPFIKLQEFLNGCLQSYITRVLVDQAVVRFSLSSYSDNISDDYLQKYVNPYIAVFVGLGVGTAKYLLTYDAENPKSFSTVIVSGGVSAMNSSFGCIYNFMVDGKMISPISDSMMWKKTVMTITKICKAVFCVKLPFNFVSAVVTAFLVNMALRAMFSMYANYKKNIGVNTKLNHYKKLHKLYQNKKLALVYEEKQTPEVNKEKDITEVQKEKETTLSTKVIPNRVMNGIEFKKKKMNFKNTFKSKGFRVNKVSSKSF